MAFLINFPILYYSPISVNRPPLIWISLLTGHDLTVYVVYLSFISPYNLPKSITAVVKCMFYFIIFNINHKKVKARFQYSNKEMMLNYKYKPY